MNEEYERFLASKRVISQPTGIENPPDLHPSLFPFQRDIVKWALRRGRAALFEECGLGKSRQAIEWARVVTEHTGKPTLIATPLAVARQFVREGEAIGVEITHCKEAADINPRGINVVNYERIERFDARMFGGFVADESSVIKNHDSKTRNLLIESFRETPFKLACTATPSPNDHVELGNHAEFLGVMSRTEMLSMFFVHDAGETQTWRLKGHAKKEFWRWVCSWAVSLMNPRDLGYEQEGYDLPELRWHEHVIQSSDEQARGMGMLFAANAQTLQERRGARRASLGERVALAAELANSDDNQWILWTDLNDESAQLSALISDSVEVTGSDSTEYKEDAIAAFTGAICECEFYRRHGKKGARKIGNTTTPTETLSSRTTGGAVRRSRKNNRQSIAQKSERLISDGEMKIQSDSKRPETHPQIAETPETGSFTQPIRHEERPQGLTQSDGLKPIQTEDSRTISNHMESPQSNTGESLPSRGEFAQSVNGQNQNGSNEKASRVVSPECTLTIATSQGESEGSFAPTATWGSASLKTMPTDLSPQRCTCGGRKLRAIVSKGAIFGWGVNLQNCHKTAFVGLSDSFEAMYQSVRRVWRFGQTSPVDAHVITSSSEGAVLENIRRKQRDFEVMTNGMVEHMREVSMDQIRGAVRTLDRYDASRKMWIPPWLRHQK